MLQALLFEWGVGRGGAPTLPLRRCVSFVNTMATPLNTSFFWDAVSQVVFLSYQVTEPNNVLTFNKDSLFLSILQADYGRQPGHAGSHVMAASMGGSDLPWGRPSPFKKAWSVLLSLLCLRLSILSSIHDMWVL